MPSFISLEISFLGTTDNVLYSQDCALAATLFSRRGSKKSDSGFCSRLPGWASIAEATETMSYT